MNGLIRNASHWPDHRVEQAVAFCARHLGMDVEGIAFEFSDHTYRPYRGTACQPFNRKTERRRQQDGPQVRYLVTVSIGPERAFPVTSLVNRCQYLPAGTTEAEARRVAANIDPRWRPRLEERWGEKTVQRFDFDRERFTYEQVDDTRYVICTRQPYGGRRARLVEVRTRMEALIAVTAHELMHIDQFRKRRKTWERECEEAAGIVLAMWRTFGGDRLH